MKIRGFSLSELLIALAILGVIAVFTIPKVLQAEQERKYEAIAKEAAGTVSQAFQLYKLNNTVSATTHFSALTPYMNYVSVQTTGATDRQYSQTGTWACSATVPCLKLHNGALLSYYAGGGGATQGNYFGGTTNLDYIYFRVDPDGVVTSSASATGDGKTLVFFIFTNGRLKLMADCLAGEYTYEDGSQQDNCPGLPGNIPPWFSWE